MFPNPQAALPLPAQPDLEQHLRVDSIVEDSKERLWYKFMGDPGTYYCLSQGRLTTFAGVPAKSYVSYQDVKGNLWQCARDGHTNLWKEGKATPLEGFSPRHLCFGDSKTGKDRFGWEPPKKGSSGPLPGRSPLNRTSAAKRGMSSNRNCRTAPAAFGMARAVVFIT
jgi:hypothetical protein